ncbi:MAG: tyrosine-type recombinase/integrase [Caldisericia bacterium]|nr:tyrosine-type recombinase/integrase [Caldisericia bacterium]
MTIDPYKSKEVFERWLSSIEGKKEIEGLNEIHSKLLISIIKDLRIGINVSSKNKKGERSFTRLNHLEQKLRLLFRLLQERGISDVRKANAQNLHSLFSDMRSGVISTKFGTPFKATGDYVKEFKTFWHWYQKVERGKGNLLPDITEDLDKRGEKPKFVYFTKADFENIVQEASYDLKPILALAFDSGMRPTELINVKISDFYNDFKELNIREETSKTFGRRIKLQICSEQIKEFVNKLGLERDDYFCRKNIPTINKELRKIGKKVLTPQQIKFGNLTLYSFRHSSACFWVPRYKSESGLKYRFGWKKSDMIHYYTEFLGMKDTITEEDMYIDITKTDLEKEVGQLRDELQFLKVAVKKLLGAVESGGVKLITKNLSN